jgi:hypothetical protein
MRSTRRTVKKRGNTKRLILLISIVFIALTIILLLIKIDINGVKQKIAAEVSSQLKGEVVIARAYFSLLPYPHVTLRGVKITSPQWGKLAAAKVRIYPRLFSLLQEKVLVKRLQIKGLIVDLVLRKESIQQGKDIFSNIDQTVIRMAPSLAVEGGTVNLLRPEEKEPFFTAHGVAGNMAFSKKGGRLDLRFSSPWAEGIELRVSNRAKDNKGKPYSLLATGTGVKVEKVRGFVLELFGKNETAQEVFRIVQGGELSQITFRGEGSSFEEALDFERNMKIRGTFAHGKIMTPPGPLPLEEVSGEFKIEEAVLQCWDIDLHLGRSTGRKGKLLLGLIAKQEAFHLDIVLDAAAEDLVRYLPLVIKDKGLMRELDNFREAQGRGKGRLVLGDNINHISPTVDVKNFQLSFHHASSPGLISLVGGQLSLKDGEGVWQADTITWKQFRWKNAAGGITLRDQGINIAVTQADLCGLQCKGNMDSHAGTVTHAYRIWTGEGDLSSAIRCLWGVGMDARIEGNFLLDGDMWAEGREDPLREASEGTVYFRSQKGRIYRWTLLSQLFGTLNIIGLVQGDHPDFTQKGFQYDTFTITGELRDGNLYLKEAVIDGPSMKIVGEGKIDLVKGEADMVVLLAPLKTVDTILNYIPVVGKIMTGKDGVFISVPFSVKGPLDDPSVMLLPPKAVRSGLWGVLKKTLQTPVEMFKAISQKKPSLVLPQAKTNKERTTSAD